MQSSSHSDREARRPASRRVPRRSFIRMGVVVGTTLPVVTTLTPTEARAQSSGGS